MRVKNQVKRVGHQSWTPTGFSLPDEEFKVHVAYAEPDPELVRRLTYGNDVVAVLLKGYIRPEVSRALWDNFVKSAGAQERTDTVPAHKVGADQFDKSLEQYLAEVEATAPSVAKLFDGTVDVGLKARSDLQRWLGDRASVRLAEHGGRTAGAVRAVRWKAPGARQLDLHTDEPQMRQPEQAGFEIQETLAPVAFNLYPVAEKGSGLFSAYNLQPDGATLRRLGIEFTGHPFPPELLHGVKSIQLEIESGDAVLFNGRFLHGVLAPQRPGAARLLLNFFFAAKRDTASVVCWT
jgi:hypothetical protein